MDAILANIHGLIDGLLLAMQPANLWIVFVGCFMGTLVGVLPGIGPVAAISILLPLTFQMTPLGAIIMLAGIYYGAMYGGSTTSILMNVPGETASVMTCVDGYPMARQGKAGPALGISAIASFIAGTLGLIGLQVIAYPLATIALKFGPSEYFAIILLGFTMIIYLAGKSILKAAIMVCAGIILGCVGLDPITSQQRMTFGVLNLFEGIGIAPMAMGLFGVAEVLSVFESMQMQEPLKVKVKSLFPTRLDWIQSKWAILRGTLIGFFMGIIPGGGPILSTFIAYSVEKQVSKKPEQFGHGAIEGVASPEAASNAASSTSFIPLLILGIPPNVILAVLYSAFLIHGVSTGPLLLKDHPDIFWGVLGSMYIGNVILLILNLPLIPLWVQLLRIPGKLLYPLVLLFCLVGAYSINNNVFDIGVMIFFGIAGYLMKKFDYERAPLIMAFVLGPMFEVNLRRSLILSDGSFSIFFNRPISLTAMLLACAIIVYPLWKYFRLRSR